MKLRFRNWNIILHLRLVLESGLIPLLHTCFVQTLFKTFQTENTCYLIISVTEGLLYAYLLNVWKMKLTETQKETVLTNRKKYKSGQQGIILRVFQQFFTGGPVIKQSIAQN